MLWSGNIALRLQVLPVRVFHDRLDVLRARRAGLEMMRAFADAPAVVAALDDQVHFLPQILADIADPQRAGLPVKAVTPRIAQAVGVNFLARAALAHVRLVHKRIVARDAVLQVPAGCRQTRCRCWNVHVNAQHFGEQAWRCSGRCRTDRRRRRRRRGRDTRYPSGPNASSPPL